MVFQQEIHSAAKQTKYIYIFILEFYIQTIRNHSIHMNKNKIFFPFKLQKFNDSINFTQTQTHF